MVPLMQGTVKRGQLDHFYISFAKNEQMPIMSFQFVHIRINISGNTVFPANHFAPSYGNSNYRGVLRGSNGGQKVGHANSRFFCYHRAVSPPVLLRPLEVHFGNSSSRSRSLGFGGRPDRCKKKHTTTNWRDVFILFCCRQTLPFFTFSRARCCCFDREFCRHRRRRRRWGCRDLTVETT